ncbi:MAG: class II aldolase/adducin family protein [Deltaproteobacteria bacterium]|nr:class II aldolase/adducin family protein [Deltaproteobacteria bacterium]
MIRNFSIIFGLSLLIFITTPEVLWTQSGNGKEKNSQTSPVSESLKNEQLRQKLEQAHRIIYMMGLAEDSTRGHITAKSDDGLYYIKPWGTAFEKVTAKEMQGLDIEGNLVDGRGRVHSEKYLHLEIYRARKDVGAIVHVHPFYSIILSTLFDGKLSTIAQQSVPFTGKIPIFVSPELIQTKELGQAVAKTLGDAPLLLMKNHGITVVGKTLEEAVVLAIHFEQAAKYHLYAHKFGKPSEMSHEDAQKLYKNNYRPDQIKMQWDFWLDRYNELKVK